STTRGPRPCGPAPPTRPRRRVPCTGCRSGTGASLDSARCPAAARHGRERYGAGPMGTLEAYDRDTFTHGGKQRAVYRRGTGPAVIVIAEIPGITPKVIELADRAVDLGCTAVLPHLFGEPGAEPSPVAIARSIGPACVS